MRKLLLATTALFGSVAFIGAAHASPAPTSPITLNVGGYVDFVAGFYHEADGTTPTIGNTSRDFEDEFKLNFDAMGKAANGMQYGANVSLWNGPEATNLWQGGKNGVELASAYVWMSGAFGKVLLGDAHGASDLFVYAPTVGEGQIDGRYMDFTSVFSLARFYGSGIDNTEHSTNITYYTPKVGNDDNKVQLGITYEPNMYDYGSNVTFKFDNTTGPGVSGTDTSARTVSPYQDVVKGALEYTGNFHPVNLAASAQIITGSASSSGSERHCSWPRRAGLQLQRQLLAVQLRTSQLLVSEHKSASVVSPWAVRGTIWAVTTRRTAKTRPSKTGPSVASMSSTKLRLASAT